MVRSEVILVTGAASCVGQHVIAELQTQYEHVAGIRTLDLARTFTKRLPYKDAVPVNSFRGSCSDRGQMKLILKNVTTVLHLMDHQDFSMCPDAGRMHRVNVQELRSLLAACEGHSTVRRLVLGSSVLVNVSNTWPSVWNPELQALPPDCERVLPHYTNTKLAAEQMVGDCKGLQTCVARLAAVYGECDEQSVFVQLLAQTRAHHNQLPVLGDQGGVMQMCYAGNAAHGLVLMLRKMHYNSWLSGEVVFLLDDTPVEGVYQLMAPIASALKLHAKPIGVPFLLFYWAYRALECVSGVCPDAMQRWPSADFLYLWFYHWVFFSDFRARTLLDYRPKYSYAQSVRRSLPHYQALFAGMTP